MIFFSFHISNYIRRIERIPGRLERNRRIGIRQQAASNFYILSQLYKNQGQAGILTEG